VCITVGFIAHALQMHTIVCFNATAKSAEQAANVSAETQSDKRQAVAAPLGIEAETTEVPAYTAPAGVAAAESPIAAVEAFSNEEETPAPAIVAPVPVAAAAPTEFSNSSKQLFIDFTLV
jgi:hypothetical protein